MVNVILGVVYAIRANRGSGRRIQCMGSGLLPSSEIGQREKISNTESQREKEKCPVFSRGIFCWS